MEKKTLSITVNHTIYDRLKEKIGKGKISKFAESLFEEKLNERVSELANAYKEAYKKNSPLLKVSKSWEKAQNEDWVKFATKKNEQEND